MEDRQPASAILIVSLILGIVALIAVSASYAKPNHNNATAGSKANILLAVNTFVYNPKTLRWKAIKNGRVIRTGRGSGGSTYCRDVKRACKTPTGTFRIISKRGASCRSSRYPLGKGGAPMPYCMFFSKYYAIHGSPNVPNRNASHGCIRVKTHDARWLHRHFLHIGAKVVVKSY